MGFRFRSGNETRDFVEGSVWTGDDDTNDNGL
jgi:hypothetical protein